MSTEFADEHVDPHWRNAPAYDWENADFDQDIGYWTGTIERFKPARVLDLACGTGRITMPLAAAGLAFDAGFRITGIDYSPPMIALARDKQAALPAPVRDAISYLDADMRNLSLPDRFNLVVCGFNAFSYLHTIDDQLDCLDVVRSHLAPGGRFALDLVVPHAGFLDEATSPVPLVRVDSDVSNPAPDVARVRRTYSDRYDTSTQTITTTYSHEVQFRDGRQDRWLDDLRWHMTFPRELELLLRFAGFTVEERFGAYDRSPFGPGSFQYLWVMSLQD